MKLKLKPHYSGILFCSLTFIACGNPDGEGSVQNSAAYEKPPPSGLFDATATQESEHATHWTNLFGYVDDPSCTSNLSNGAIGGNDVFDYSYGMPNSGWTTFSSLEMDDNYVGAGYDFSDEYVPTSYTVNNRLSQLTAAQKWWLPFNGGAFPIPNYSRTWGLLGRYTRSGGTVVFKNSVSRRHRRGTAANAAFTATDSMTCKNKFVVRLQGLNQSSTNNATDYYFASTVELQGMMTNGGWNGDVAGAQAACNATTPPDMIANSISVWVAETDNGANYPQGSWRNIGRTIRPNSTWVSTGSGTGDCQTDTDYIPNGAISYKIPAGKKVTAIKLVTEATVGHVPAPVTAWVWKP